MYTLFSSICLHECKYLNEVITMRMLFQVFIFILYVLFSENNLDPLRFWDVVIQLFFYMHSTVPLVPLCYR